MRYKRRWYLLRVIWRERLDLRLRQWLLLYGWMHDTPLGPRVRGDHDRTYCLPYTDPHCLSYSEPYGLPHAQPDGLSDSEPHELPHPSSLR